MCSTALSLDLAKGFQTEIPLHPVGDGGQSHPPKAACKLWKQRPLEGIGSRAPPLAFEMYQSRWCLPIGYGD